MQANLLIGQHSSAGQKSLNQDYCSYYCPTGHLRHTKGITTALSDGISPSPVSHIASKAAVQSFIEDYYSTSEAWSVETAGKRVIAAANAWLYSHGQKTEARFNAEKGYVCTFSALVIKGDRAHIFHIGDSRVYRIRDGKLEQLTVDHRGWTSEGKSYLARAMGISEEVEVDYRRVTVQPGDIFVLSTDGIHDVLSNQQLLQLSNEKTQSMDSQAQSLTELALQQGSDDNLSLQIVKIFELDKQAGPNITDSVHSLPLPPQLEPGQLFDGFRIERQLHHSARSQVFLVTDINTSQQVVMKVPSVDMSEDIAFLERFLLEEWIARRLHSVHVLKAPSFNRPKQYLYTLSEYVKGRSLAQWLVDNPTPTLEQTRNIIEQVARGLESFHRLEMLHQDLRPENILIDEQGTVKIIDFGSTTVAGLQEINQGCGNDELLGTALYMAPEYYLGESGSHLSEQFSLATLTYYMLSGKFPYGTQMAKTTSRSGQRRLQYQSLRDDNSTIPAWVDAALRKALHVDPYKRYAFLSEFVFDLRHPNKAFLEQTKPPLIERHPKRFWQIACALSVILNLYLLHYITHN